jgi:hypothetical protein
LPLIRFSRVDQTLVVFNPEDTILLWAQRNLLQFHKNTCRDLISS